MGSPLRTLGTEYRPEEEFRRPLIERLPPASRHYLREAIAREKFLEASEAFLDSVAAEVTAVRLEPLPG
ncbi:MAG: hypothetical protein ACT4O1_07335 [Gemmatimonadota bacterium]